MSGAPATRTESDAFGPVEIPAGRYWGAQTQRALGVFRIGEERLQAELVRCFGLQKQAAARANVRFARLAPDLAEAIEAAAAELAAGRFDDHFPLPVWQTGSGTQTNMNANEVIANRANETLGAPLGGRAPVHPNDHVNLSQSSNDSFPTVMNVAAVLAAERRLLPALARLHGAFEERAAHFGDLLKIGRTHLNDALPIPLGLTFAAYARQVANADARVRACLPDLRQVAQGGTANGSGVNAPDGFDIAFCEVLSELAGTAFEPNPVKVEGMAAHDDLVALSAALAGAATALTKIADDLRLLGSGPRCGLNELRLPDDGLTSSIMPGKRNATVAEAVLQVCQRIAGNHVTVSLAGASGALELNVSKPVLIHAVLQSVSLLEGAADAFAGFVSGIEANEAQLRRNVSMSLMLATALTPVLGYDAVAKIARLAEAEDLTVEQAALKLGYLDEASLKALLDPRAMVKLPSGKP